MEIVGVVGDVRQSFEAGSKAEIFVPYDSDDLDILSRVFHDAFDSVPKNGRDAEATKIVIMSGILDAARNGERDEECLKASALESIKLYDEGHLDAEMRTTPL